MHSGVNTLNNVVKISTFSDTLLCPHWDRPALFGYIYEDVFDPLFFESVKNTVKSQLDDGRTSTYLTHTTTFKLGSETRKIVGHAQNNREQVVIYDVTFLKDYYNQTADTIYEWYDETVKNSISPIFYKVLKHIENLHPFNQEKGEWIFYRLHLNYLVKGKYLAIHIDSAPHLTNVKLNEKTVDHSDARMSSLTFYFYDHKPGLGGELWTPSGFVYKPKANTMINLNGHQAFHGVTQNLDTEPRLAFTIRAIHKDDLYLPGSTDKLLYNNISENLI
jgi:hypothetical protein